MKDYVIILKGELKKRLSESENKSLMVDYKKWTAELGENYMGGQRLGDSGSLITGKSDSIITDGPFAEANEVIAGFMLIRAENQDAANAIGLKLPHLDLYTLEIRPIAHASK